MEQAPGLSCSQRNNQEQRRPSEFGAAHGIEPRSPQRIAQEGGEGVEEDEKAHAQKKRHLEQLAGNPDLRIAKPRHALPFPRFAIVANPETAL